MFNLKNYKAEAKTQFTINHNPVGEDSPSIDEYDDGTLMTQTDMSDCQSQNSDSFITVENEPNSNRPPIDVWMMRRLLELKIAKIKADTERVAVQVKDITTQC